MAQRSPEWTRGFNAFFNEGMAAVNPFDEGTRSFKEWNNGFIFASTYDSTPSGVTRKPSSHIQDLDDGEDDYAI